MKQVDQTKNLLYVIIGILVVAVIALGAYVVTGKQATPPSVTGTGTVQASDLKITIISDKRCTSCPPTEQIISQVKQIPFLSTAAYTGKDFADAGVAEYLKTNKITLLPAFILSSKDVGDAKFQELLMPVENDEYAIKPEASGGNFDPFAKRSEKGFLLIDKTLLSEIKGDSYTSGNKDADITWLEYSDLQCPYCIKLHNSDVWPEVTKKYGAKINKIFNHFPLSFHENAKPAAMILECLGEQKGAEKFYELIDKAYAKEDSAKDYLVTTAVSLGANKATLEKCVNDKKFEKKIDDETTRGAKSFGVTGTPGIVLINNKTGEYEMVVGAQQKEAFITVIDKLLK